MSDDIKLPPEFISGNGIPVERATITADRMKEILADAVLADRQQRGTETEMVFCGCGDGYPADSYGAGFIDAKGVCENCDAANTESDDAQHVTVEDERAAFEAEYPKHYGSRQGIFDQDGRGVYADKQVQAAFSLWQARAALDAQRAGAKDAIREALEESTALLVAMLHETRHPGEISLRIVDNRAAIQQSKGKESSNESIA